MLPYGRQSISEEDIEAVVKVLRGDWLTTGPVVDQFEQKISKISGNNFVVSTTSGTAALHTAYGALGIGPGDEVITTPMTFVATASCAAMHGAKIRFADVCPETGLIDPASVEALTNEQTKVIAAVDYAGQPADYPEMNRIARAVGAVTLADAAHSIGGFLNGHPVGDLADVTVYSFFPTKNLTTGEGGAVVAKDQKIIQRAREFHNIGLVRDADRFMMEDEGPWHQEVHEFGLNYRLTDIGCALGISQLQKLAAFKQQRAQIVARYNQAFFDLEGIATPVQVEESNPMWHLYTLRVLGGRRRTVFEKLRANGVGVQVNYLPVYWHPVFASMGYERGLCPNAEKYYSEEISLPLFADMSDSQVDFVIEQVFAAVS